MQFVVLRLAGQLKGPNAKHVGKTILVRAWSVISVLHLFDYRLPVLQWLRCVFGVTRMFFLQTSITMIQYAGTIILNLNGFVFVQWRNMISRYILYKQKYSSLCCQFDLRSIYWYQVWELRMFSAMAGLFLTVIIRYVIAVSTSILVDITHVVWPPIFHKCSWPWTWGIEAKKSLGIKQLLVVKIVIMVIDKISC